jgi:hypothetical protein
MQYILLLATALLSGAASLFSVVGEITWIVFFALTLTALACDFSLLVRIHGRKSALTLLIVVCHNEVLMATKSCITADYGYVLFNVHDEH